MEYEDFLIQIGPDRGDGYPVQVLKSPAGEGRGSFKLPLGMEQMEALLVAGGHRIRSAAATLDMRVEMERDLRPQLPEPAARLSAQQVGDQLFRSLFSGQIRSLYDQSLGTIGSRPGCGLRIKLKLDARHHELAHLSSLPWEFLWRGDTQDFLSLSRRSPVIRYLDVPRQAAPIVVPGTLRILVVTSNPAGLAPLDLERERSSLESACREWKGVEVEILNEADPGMLRRALLEKDFHVLHFMGHGGFDTSTGEGVLHFQAPDGGPEPVTGQALAALLKDFRSLGLVFLNACDSARSQSHGFNPFSGVAGALVLGGLPAVVAMQFPISDRAAIAFSKAFYQRLALGDPVDAAVVEGRQAVLSTDSHSMEWGTPVLFLRVPDATVFKVQRDEPRQPMSLGGVLRRLAGKWRQAVLVLTLACLLGGLAIPVFRLAGSPPAGYVLEVGREFSSTLSGVTGTLTQAELLPNGRMRLHLRFRNRSPKSVGVGLDYRSTYLADRDGNKYPVLAADARESTMAPLPPGGEVERWMEFPAPRDQARNFQVSLINRNSVGFDFPLFDVKLPVYPSNLSVPTKPIQPAPGSAPLTVNASFRTNVAGFQSELRGVELRKDGRMRWSFAFLNGTGSDQAVGFDYAGIYLVDQDGHHYPVLGSDTGGHPGQIYTESLQRALRADHWIEFSAPLQGARSFTVVLVSHDQRALKFLPFHVTLPYYPPQYSTTAPLPKPVASKPAAPPKPLLQKPVEAVPPSVSPALSPATDKQAEPQTETQTEPSKTLVTKAGQGFDTSVSGLTGHLNAIERLDDGRLRLIFEFINQSGEALELGLNARETYLSDNLGHRYSVVRTDLRNGPGGISLESLAAGSKATHWFEFPSPTDGAQKLLVVLSSHDPSLRFPPFPAELPRREAASP